MIDYKDYKKAVKHRLYAWCLDNAIRYEKFKELIAILDDVDFKMQHNVKLVNYSFPSSSEEFTGTQETVGLYYCPSCHATTSIVADQDKCKCPWCGAAMEKLA